MADRVAETTGKRSRSPGYPAVGLEEALKRARELYQHERRNAAPVGAILDHWGYKSGSGYGMVVLAALKKFGLLVDEGSGNTRKARLSDMALRIILDEREDSTERQRLISEAALKPTIHGELWREYRGSLPSDASLKHRLLVDEGFTDRAVAEFIPQFRATVAFAGLTESDRLIDSAEDTEAGTAGARRHEEQTPKRPSIFDPLNQVLGQSRVTLASPIVESPTAAAMPTVLQLPIPLPDTDQLAALQVPIRMSEAAWAQMLAIINAYKPSIVKPAATADASQELDGEEA